MRTPTSPKGFTEGSSYQKTLSEKDKSITKLELTKNLNYQLIKLLHCRWPF